ncbi:MAG: peptidase S41, partial [Pseudomonadota bacterium]
MSIPNPVRCAAAISGLLAILLVHPVLAAEGYYRGPSLAGGALVFSAEGDLWRTTLEGSAPHRATRLTTHPDLETQAMLSPDGERVAYVARYTGSDEIYTIPIGGGLPRRVTFDLGRIHLQHWVDNNKLLYTTDATPGAPSTWVLKTIDLKSGASRTLPVADAFAGFLHKQGRRETLFFVQYGIGMTTDNTNFYRGGMRGRLWRFNPDTDVEATPLLGDHEGNVRNPMVYDERVYFVSDASGRDNLWSSNFDGEDLRQETRDKKWSLREVRMGAGDDDGKVVLRKGADVHIINLEDSKPRPRKLELSLSSDHPEKQPRWIKNPLQHLTSVTYTSELDKVLLTARGKMAVIGLDRSRLVTINTPTTSRNRAGALSQDGAWVYALSDRSGEVEVWRFAADGAADAKQLSRDRRGFKENLQLSPEGKWLTYTDGMGSLWILDTKTEKKTRIIDESDGFAPFGRIAWAPGEQTLAVAHTPLGETRPRILLYGTSDRRQSYVTSARYSSRSPTFSPDGNWLYYLSERNFSPTPSNPWQDRDFGAAFDRRSLVLASALTDDAQFPFDQPTELSLAANRDKEQADEADKDRQTDKSDNTESQNIDWESVGERLYQVPVPAHNYNRVVLNDKRLYVQVVQRNGDALLQSTPLSPKPKLTTFATKTSLIDLSSDGKKLALLRRDRKNDKHRIMIVPAAEKMPKDLKDKVVKTADWQFEINPVDEWRQIFHDAWFMHRELFFDA